MDRVAFESLRRRDMPAPIDALNLLTLSARPASYLAYGALVWPLVRLAGGHWPWVGRRLETLAGPRTADFFVVCRYPTHRRFFGMVDNPYYRLANRFRTGGGVAGFEFGLFAPRAGAAPIAAPWRGPEPSLIVQWNPKTPDAADAVRDVLAALPGETVYASSLVAAMTEALHGPYRRDDPNTPSFRENRIVRLADVALARRCCQDAGRLRELAAATEGFAVDLYERTTLSAMRSPSR
jgi:hypothetical protein